MNEETKQKFQHQCVYYFSSLKSSLLIFQAAVSFSILNMQTNPHGHTRIQVSEKIRITHIDALYMEIFLVTQNGSFHCLTVNSFLIKPDNTSFCCFSRLLAASPDICTSCIYKYTYSRAVSGWK